MPRASFVQTSFLGGYWGKLAQGRMESKNYKLGLDTCTNYMPLEQGPLLRRQGTRYITHTRRGNKAKLIPFDFSIIQPYQLELTAGFARFYEANNQVLTDPSRGIVNISTATPAVVTTADAHGWTTADDVVFEIPGNPCRATLLCNRQFTITVLSTTTFSIADALTGVAINGATVAWTASPGSDDRAFRILEVTTPYTTAQVTDRALNHVQDETTLLLLRPDVKPYLLQQGGTFFQLAAASFTDGPYLDANTTTTTLTPSGTSGSVTLTASSTTGINSGSGFLSTDVGRQVRLMSTPAAWASGTTYAVGALVTYTDGNVYTSLTAGNIGHNPAADITNWAISPNGIVWNWGTITAITDTTHVTVTLSGTTALLNTAAITTWRLGLFSNTTGWPTCGGYHEGRLWLGGVLGNRFDASKSGSHYDFSPTAVDGTVADDNAIAATFTAQDVNQILWFLPEEDGLYAGTQAGEWRIRASTFDDPITPTSIQARRLTTYGCAPVQAVELPQTLMFVQRQRRKVYDYVAQGDKRKGDNLNETAPDLTVSGVAEIGFTSEPSPTIWMLRQDGILEGGYYRRGSDGANIGWFNIEFGTERLIESISTGPDADSLGQTVFMISADADDDTAPRWVEMLTPIFDDQTPDHKTWFVDSGIVPCCATLTGNLTVGNLTFYGLSHLEGESVCPVIDGIDAGPATVTNGAVTVALGSDEDGALTGAFLTSTAGEGLDYGDYGVTVLVATGSSPTPAITAPSILGYLGSAAGPTGNVSSVNGQSCAPDWDGSNLYMYKAGTSGTDGLIKFGLDTGDRGIDATVTALTVTRVDATSGGAFVFLPDGHLAFVSDSGNSSKLATVNASALTLASQFGTASSSTSPSTSLRILKPQHLISHTLLGSAESELVALSVPSQGEVYTFAGSGADISAGGVIAGNAGEIYVYGCEGYSESSWSTAFVIGSSNWQGGAAANTSPVTLYRQAGSGLATVGTVSPAQVDATWTNFSKTTGLLFDQTDGNLLTVFQTTDVVTNKQYVAKINSATAAVMWKVPINNVDSSLDNTMHRGRIKAGTFFYVGSSAVVYTINTSTGASTNQTITGLGTGVSQISDDVSNSVIMFGSWSGAALAYLGTWMGSPGNHTNVSNFWIRLFLGTIIGQDRTRLAAQTIYTLGAPIGKCYTSTWKLLRPDSGQDAGAANGPAFGKLRRVHWWAANVYRTRSMSVGFDTSHLFPVKFHDQGKVIATAPTLYSGIVTTTFADTQSFNGQIMGQQSKAYPGILTAVAGYVECTDK